jgi:hypothetical protein
MLPFSFLLDYVFQVAKSLKLAEIDRNLDLSVVNYCESILSTTGRSFAFNHLTPTVYGFIVDGKYYPPDTKKDIPFMGYHGSRYTRILTDPLKYGLILPQWKTPSINQWYNTGALLKTLFF